MLLRRLNIAPRALLCFGFFALLITAFGLFSLGQVTDMKASQTRLRTNVLPSIQTIDDLTRDLLAIRLYNTSLRSAKDDATVAMANQRVVQGRAALEADAAKLEPLLINPDGQALYRQLRDAISRYLQVHAQYLDAVKQHQEDRINTFTAASGEMTQAAEAVRQLIDTLSTRIDQKAENEDALAASTYTWARNITIIAIAVALLATLALAALFTRSLVAPINRALGVAERIAANDFTQQVAADGHDEPGRLLAALARMRENLRQTLSALGDSSTQLASTSEEMTAVTEEALRGIARQNDEITQAATAINQMTAAVDEVASNAAQASRAASASSESVSQGKQRVEQTVQVINELHGAVGATAEEIDGLAVQVRGISGVLDVIRGIAEQTNLLALNAAIEAARAGEAGRGFAVVADEVRALAHRTQQSTGEIEQMIASIQAGAGKAVNAMASSSQRAEQSLEVAQAAGVALEEITAAIAQINERNVSIASATEQQAQVAREVDRNLTSIRDMSTQTAAGANQTAAASGELSQLAVGLNEVVLRFRM